MASDITDKVKPKIKVEKAHVSYRPEPRVALVNEISAEIAGIFERKRVNISEMGMTAIVILQIMKQYGADTDNEIPSFKQVESEGTIYEYRIKKAPKKTAILDLGNIN